MTETGIPQKAHLTPPSSARKILHVDMDAFFTSVEQHDNPQLRGKPVVVGGDPQGRGVVAGASYEARNYGIHSAMSCSQAKRLCPKAVFLFPRFERYQAVSREIHKIFQEVTTVVEPLSLDEAYLDVTTNHLKEPLARTVGHYVRARIYETTGLTASAGAGPNKFIAKIASDLRKPNGLVVIAPEKVLSFLENMPVERLWGVGPATTKILHALQLKTAGDIRRAAPELLEESLGKFGRFLYGLAHGIDDRPVEPHGDPKSRGAETTFRTDVYDRYTLSGVIKDQAQEVATSLQELGRRAKTITLKIRYSDFSTITRSRTLLQPTDNPSILSQTAIQLLNNHTEAGKRPVRLIGVSVSQLISPLDPQQLWLDLDIY